MFDYRADRFCLVSSDSDSAYLCSKLRERGATVYVVGEQKTPDALRNASNQFFEWTPPGKQVGSSPAREPAEAPVEKPALPLHKRRPRFVIEAVALLANNTADVLVLLSGLKRMAPAFHRPKTEVDRQVIVPDRWQPTRSKAIRIDDGSSDTICLTALPRI